MSELSSAKHVVAQVGGNDDALLDVIFLHGLGGSLTDTWTTSSGVFWPKEWLAPQLPQTRIFAVGYPATMLKVGSSANKMRISDHAGTILDYLEAEGIGDKPIVFVCHSLGGLVVKAMLQAADNREFDTAIVRNTRVRTYKNALRDSVVVIQGSRREPMDERSPFLADRRSIRAA